MMRIQGSLFLWGSQSWLQPAFSRLSVTGANIGRTAPTNANGNFAFPRRLVGSFVYELPLGRGKRFLNRPGLVDKILGGWQIGTIATFSDGTPVGVATFGVINTARTMREMQVALKYSF